MSRRAGLGVAALSAVLLIVGLVVEDTNDGPVYWLGWGLVALAWVVALAARIGPNRRAARENARLRAALLDGEIPPRADAPADRPNVADDNPDR